MSASVGRAHLPGWRGLVAAFLAALIAPLLPLSTSAMAAVVARDIGSSCPPGRVPDAGFVDTAGTTFEHEIDCIVGYGIARGVTASTFDPSAQVDRGQMATFLARVLVAGGRTPPAGLADAFDDDDGTAHEANINWLAAEGILSGFPDGTVRSLAPVSRAQMATFLNNIIRELTGNRYASATNYFADDDNSPHEANINGLARVGIVTGTGQGTYDPSRDVTRGQMAGFLAREVDSLVDRGLITVPFGPEVITVTPTSRLHLNASDNSSNATDDVGQREFLADVPIGIESVTIALLPPSQLGTTVDGVPRFTAGATISPNSGVSIEVVNGVRRDQADGSGDQVQVNDVSVPSDGHVTFTIDAVSMVDVVPIVYADLVNSALNQLDLEPGATTTAPQPAREPVGVGGVTSWGPDEPAAGTDLAAGRVRDINHSAGWYTLDTEGGAAADWMLRYANGDQFSYTASADPVAGSPGPITRSQFETWVSVGDRIDPGRYEPGRMAHVITGDVPAAPTNVVGTLLGDGRVRVTFAKPSNPVADDEASSFRLQRAVLSGGVVGTFAEVAARAADLTAEFTDAPTSTGTFAYRVVARSVTGDGPASMIVQVTVSAPAPATTASRVRLDNSATNTSGANAVLDYGDRIEFTFDRAITVSSGWTLGLLDKDGTQVRLESPNVTPIVSGTAGNVLTLYVGTGALTLVAAGANGVLDISPSTTSSASTGFVQVLSSTGVGNATAGWNLPKSGLGAPYNNSRVIIDGTGDGAITPPAPAGHLVATAVGSRLEAGLDEVQSVTAAANATGGTWTLTFSGQTTAPLAHDADATVIQTALAGLPSVGSGNVVVSGGPIATTPVTVRFAGALGGLPQPALTVDASGLTGETEVVAPTVATVTDGVAVTGIGSGDRVTVYTTAGVLVGSAAAGANGRATVLIAPPASPGQTLYVVIEQVTTARRSRTAVAVVS